MSSPTTIRRLSSGRDPATCPALPRFSSRMYLRLPSEGISLLKFLLEAEDNLAYLSTVSPHTAVVKLVFAPGRGREVREFLETVRPLVTFRELLMVHEGEGREES